MKPTADEIRRLKLQVAKWRQAAEEGQHAKAELMKIASVNAAAARYAEEKNAIYQGALKRIAESPEQDLGVYAAFAEETAREALGEYDPRPKEVRRHAMAQAGRLKATRGDPKPGDAWWRIAFAVERVWFAIDGWAMRRIADIKRRGTMRYIKAHPTSPECVAAAGKMSVAQVEQMADDISARDPFYGVEPPRPSGDGGFDA
jgi:hypothetical protein